MSGHIPTLEAQVKKQEEKLKEAEDELKVLKTAPMDFPRGSEAWQRQVTALEEKTTVLASSLEGRRKALEDATASAIGRQDALLASISELGTITSSGFSELRTLLQNQRQPATVDMSSASENTANQVLKALGFVYKDALRAGWPGPPTNLPDKFICIPAFAMQEFPNEQSATKPYINYLECRLRTLGIKLNEIDGFSVNDLRVDGKVEILVAETRYAGVLDVGVVPAGMVGSSCIDQLRIGIELKQTDAQKKEYAEMKMMAKRQEDKSGKQSQGSGNKGGSAGGGSQEAEHEDHQGSPITRSKRRTSTPAGSSSKKPKQGEDQGSPITGGSSKNAKHGDDKASPSSGLKFSSRVKGQALLQLLAIHCRAEWPLSLYSTDGQVYHRLQLRGKHVLFWGSLSPSQAFYFMVQELNKAPTDAHFSYAEAGQLLTDEEIAPLAQLHSLVGESPLAEQLDSLLPHITDPFQRLQTAAELIRTHWPEEGVPLPECISHWYM